MSDIVINITSEIIIDIMNDIIVIISTNIIRGIVVNNDWYKMHHDYYCGLYSINRCSN